jgi:hypothetical protein
LRSLLSYYMQDYLRSYRAFAPLLIFFGLIFITYSIIPNPVMPSYSFTATLLFLVSSWICVQVLNSEPTIQQNITLLHLQGNTSIMYIAKWLVMAGFGVICTLIAVGYPILTGKFDRTPEIWEVGLAIWLHMVSMILACAIASFFSNRFISKYYQTVGGLLIILTLAISAQGLMDSLPSAFRGFIWIFPPMWKVMEVLNNADNATSVDFISASVVPLMYSGVLFIVLLLRVRSRG